MLHKILDFLLPREKKFFTYFDQHVDFLLEGARAFRSLAYSISTLNHEGIQKYLVEIQDCEQKGDDLERHIVNELNRTFITPMDREDIHHIAVYVDKALDILKSISHKFDIYKIKQLPDTVCNMAELVVEISAELGNLFTALRKDEDVFEIIRKMHNMETKGDDLFHNGMAELFSNPNYTPVDIIKYKEVYEHLEQAVDTIDYIGKIVRGIKVKQG